MAEREKSHIVVFGGGFGGLTFCQYFRHPAARATPNVHLPFVIRHLLLAIGHRQLAIGYMGPSCLGLRPCLLFQFAFNLRLTAPAKPEPAPHPSYGHPLPIRWGEGGVRGSSAHLESDLELASWH